MIRHGLSSYVDNLDESCKIYTTKMTKEKSDTGGWQWGVNALLVIVMGLVAWIGNEIKKDLGDKDTGIEAVSNQITELNKDITNLERDLNIKVSSLDKQSSLLQKEIEIVKVIAQDSVIDRYGANDAIRDLKSISTYHDKDVAIIMHNFSDINAKLASIETRIGKLSTDIDKALRKKEDE